MKGLERLEERVSYYAVIPSYILYDSDLSSRDKLMYAAIASLTYKSGKCWATNRYFGKMFNISPFTASRSINALIKKRYLNVVREKFTNKFLKTEEYRYLSIADSKRGLLIDAKGGCEKPQANNYNNNIIIDTGSPKGSPDISPIITTVNKMPTVNNNKIVYSLTEHYYDLVGEKNLTVRKNQRGRFMKGMKVLLSYADGDEVKVRSVLDKSPCYFDEMGVNWSLSAVEKHWSKIEKYKKSKTGTGTKGDIL